jgi:hypothetical protein
VVTQASVFCLRVTGLPLNPKSGCGHSETEKLHLTVSDQAAQESKGPLNPQICNFLTPSQCKAIFPRVYGWFKRPQHRVRQNDKDG